MKNRKITTGIHGLSRIAVISFLVSFTLCSVLAGITITNRAHIARLQIERLILEKSIRINEVISGLLYKTETLAVIAVQGDDHEDYFDKIAPSIVDDPMILNVLLAPDGIVSKVYPLSGNEAVVGLNFFGEGAGNIEAMAARDSGQLVMGGPFNLVQGGQALVGRMPVYVDAPNERHKFWGLVSVTLRFPQVLDYAWLESLETLGFAYELWRLNPDTNERQVIASNLEHIKPTSSFTERHVKIFNADWYLRVSPINRWHVYPENIFLIVAGLLVSFLVMFVTQNNFELNRMRSALEIMATSDPLTGIHNRRHFMDLSQAGLERSRRLKTGCYVILLDLDKFKSINDTYGHILGDKVLVEVASRVQSHIRPYDLLARYGGEEFIIFAFDIDKNNVQTLAERLRLSICDEQIEYEGGHLYFSASFGVAHVYNYDLEKAIKHADQALYTAKTEGRNRVVFHDEN